MKEYVATIFSVLWYGLMIAALIVCLAYPSKPITGSMILNDCAVLFKCVNFWAFLVFCVQYIVLLWALAEEQ